MELYRTVFIAKETVIPPPCPIHGMWGGRMTCFVAVPKRDC